MSEPTFKELYLRGLWDKLYYLLQGVVVGFVLGVVCGTFWEWFWLEKIWSLAGKP